MAGRAGRDREVVVRFMADAPSQNKRLRVTRHARPIRMTRHTAFKAKEAVNMMAEIQERAIVVLVFTLAYSVHHLFSSNTGFVTSPCSTARFSYPASTDGLGYGQPFGSSG